MDKFRVAAILAVTKIYALLLIVFSIGTIPTVYTSCNNMYADTDESSSKSTYGEKLKSVEITGGFPEGEVFSMSETGIKEGEFQYVTRDSEDGKTLIVEGIGIVDAPALIVYEVLVDFNNYKKWMPTITYSEVKEEKSGETTVDMKHSMPLVGDFDCQQKYRTEFTEKNSPDLVVSILNEYFTEMTDIIFKYTGTIDKFIGDCIMAVFGAPYGSNNDVERAVLTSLEMRAKFVELKDKWKKANMEIGLGIGLNTGEVIVGNVGSPKRMDYTAIGDSVNFASRLESIAESGHILLSESTYSEIKHKVKVIAHPDVKIKGKEGKYIVYELIEYLK